MTTAQDQATIAQMLRRKRGDAFKTTVYRQLGVTAGQYESWESGMYVPADKFAPQLAEYLELPLEDIVMAMWRSRVREKSTLRALGLTTHRPLAVAA